jgi:hypothetical protein
MKHARRYIGWGALAALVLLGLVGCGIAERPAAGGTILLNLASAQARSILPPLDLVCAEYEVSGTGPSGAIIEPTVVTGSTTLRGLIPGSWTVNVVGRNAGHTPIGAGSGSTTVQIGITSVLAITVQEYSSPNGSYSLALGWEPDIVEYPLFVGNLRDAAGVDLAQAFTMDEVACTAAALNGDLHPGWYANVVRLYDAREGLNGTEILSTGFAEAVRIAAGIQTAGNIFLHAVQGSGGIEINFTPEFNDPLVLSPVPAFGDSQIYTDQTVRYEVSAAVAATFVWYLRGQQVAVGDFYDLVANGLIQDEAYRLDVIGFSVSGDRAASGTWYVARSEYSPAMTRISGYVNTPSFPEGWAVTVFLYAASDPTTPLGQVATVNGVGGGYAFNALAPGSYLLRAHVGSPTDYSWWNSAQVKVTNPAGAEAIPMPQDGTLTYNFLMPLGG